MGFFSWLANGLGTLIGVVTEVVSTVVDTVRSVYEIFVGKGGAVKSASIPAALTYSLLSTLMMAA